MFKFYVVDIVPGVQFIDWSWPTMEPKNVFINCISFFCKFRYMRRPQKIWKSHNLFDVTWYFIWKKGERYFSRFYGLLRISELYPLPFSRDCFYAYNFESEDFLERIQMRLYTDFEPIVWPDFLTANLVSKCSST